MDRNSTTPNKLASPGLLVRFGWALRRYFITGLATLFPVTVTVWLVVTIFNFADQRAGRLFGVDFPGLGLLVTIVVIMGAGVLSIHFFGRVLFRTVELWLGRLPLFRKVYPAVKQLAQFLFNDEGKGRRDLRGVVLVQYPRLGVYTLAFVTNETQTTINGRPQTLLTLLLPNPPSPFTGPIMFVPKEDVVPLDLSVEDAVKFILSCGVVTPSLKPAVTVRS
ncbi:MAG: DUF502 domain-containing protein [Candidatus Omnitrophica bacterium]|nr:DUF502 domain-containing protein [Candidatus Omnitrophota bacterium]